VACLILYNGGNLSDLIVLGAVWLSLGLLLYLLLKTTYYTVDDTYLTCHILGFRKKISIEEIIKERFDYLDSLGLPLTISRYYIKVILEDETTYLILALDN
jgi:hypothetical protein